MMSRNDEIRQDKENKIKLLLSEFQICKQKIFQHKFERGAEQPQEENKKPQSISKPPHSHHRPPSTRKITQPHSEEYQLRKKLERAQAALEEKILSSQQREDQLNSLLQQQYHKKQQFWNQFQVTMAKLNQRYKSGFLSMNMDAHIIQRLQYYDEKLKCLNFLLQETRVSVQLNNRNSQAEIEQVIKEKLQLQFKIQYYQERLQNLSNDGGQVQELRRQIQYLREDNLSKENIISNLQKQFREEIIQYVKRIDEIGKNSIKSSNVNQEYDGLRRQYEVLKCQHQNQLQTKKQQREDYQSRICGYKSRIQMVQASMFNSELSYQKQIEKHLLELKKMNQKMTSLEDQLLKKCQEIQNIKDTNRRIQRSRQKDKNKDQQLKLTTNIKKDLEAKLLSANTQLTKSREQISKLNQQNEKLKKQVRTTMAKGDKTQERSQSSQKHGQNIKKQIEQYQNQIAQLKIALEVTNDELKQFRQAKSTIKNLQTPPKRNASLEESNRLLQAQNKQLQGRIFEYKQQIQELKKQSFSIKQKQIGSQREIQEKQQIIDQLKWGKAGFQNLFIEIEKSNQKLNSVSGNQGSGSNRSNEYFGKQPMKTILKEPTIKTNKTQKKQMKKEMPKQTKKKPVQNHIKSSIKDLDIRLINSDPEQTYSQQDQLPQIKEVAQLAQKQSSPISKEQFLNLNMHHSFNPTNTQKMICENKIKELQSEVQLLKSQNQILNKKKQSFEKQMNQLQGRQQYFLGQKEIMKGELASYLAEVNNLKQSIKKLLTFLALDSKGMIRNSIQFIKKTIFELVDMVKDASQLEKQFKQIIEAKKGFFSIL